MKFELNSSDQLLVADLLGWINFIVNLSSNGLLLLKKELKLECLDEDWCIGMLDGLSSSFHLLHSTLLYFI